MAKGYRRDQGYAWVILACCAFLISLSVGGLVGTFEVMFKRFMVYYNMEETPLTWLGTVQCGAFGFAGWVSGPLTKRFSCRTIAMVGSTMASIGLFTARYSDENIIYVTYGLITGSGFGMMHLVAIVCVQQWFNAWRCRALAVMFCGVGIGTFCWPPICVLLLDVFSLGGTLILLAGLQMQGLWCSALLRTYHPGPDELLCEEEEEDGDHTTTEKSDYLLVKAPNFFTYNYSEDTDADSDTHDVMKIRPRARRLRPSPRPLSTGYLENYQHRSSPLYQQPRNLSRIASLGTQELLDSLAGTSDDALNKITSSTNMTSPRTFTSFLDYERPGVPHVQVQDSPPPPPPPRRRGPLDSHSVFVDFIEDNQVYGPTQATIQKSKVKRYTWSAFDSKFDAMDYKDDYEVIDEEDDDTRIKSGVVYRLKPSDPVTPSSSLSLSSIITNSGVSVFKDKSYVVFILGTLVESMGFFTPLHYLPMRAVAVDKQGHEIVLILTLFATFSLLARGVAGVVGDMYPSVRSWICAGSLALAGLLTALTSFADHNTTLIIYASGLGVGAAFYLVLKNAVIVDFWGLDNMPYITGHLFACTGLSAVLMHPFTQFLLNLKGDFFKSFLVIGCLQFLGALAMFTTILMKIRQSM